MKGNKLPDTWCTTTNSFEDLFFIEKNPLTDAVFDPFNVEMLRHALSKMIKVKYGIDIGLQPLKPFKLAMMRYYNDVYCDLDLYNNVDKTLTFCNNYILTILSERVYKNIKQQLGMLSYTEERLSQIKLPNPVDTRPLGRELSCDYYYNGTWPLND